MKAISIKLLRTGEHLATVVEAGEHRIVVVEGDPSMLERLGIDKYHDLDGVRRGVQRASELTFEETVYEKWNPNLYFLDAWIPAAKAMLEELVEEGHSREEIEAELVELGIDDLPGVGEMVAEALRKKSHFSGGGSAP